MEFLILTLAAAATAAGTIYSWMQGREAWQSVAEDLGFTYTSPLLAGKRLYGERRGFDVEIDQTTDSNKSKSLVVKVKVRGLNPGFTLGRDSSFQRMLKPDIETGDPIFDQRTRIEGDPEWALALLSDEARRLTDIVISGLDGELKGNALTAICTDIQHAVTMLDTILDLAQLLRHPGPRELPKRLRERACHDPSYAVRLQAFRHLASPYALRKEALVAAEALLDSSSEPLRLEACRLLVKSSSEKSALAAEALAAIATRHQIDASIRSSALHALSESRHQQTTIPAISQVLRQPRTPPAVRRAALEGLISAEAKTELLTIQTSGEVEGEILANGLGHFDISVQPRLLQLLDGSGDRARMAAVRSLGRVGNLDAIRALRQIASQSSLFKSALAREAEQAITSIKSRSDGSQHGEISIITVAPLEGAISPSDDSEAGGEVSLTP